ncbi:MAG TPA: divergent polysaccharide deacetylase family protein [Stellaceae bacterium]|jgi:hypothetical protein|nr:divergent polysaccharide deacetylase family protein [Stellaceae bacterium]
MSDLPPHTVTPHHNGGTPRRHRFWVVLGAVVLCAAVLVLAVDWFSGGPDNSTVAVSLPPGGGVTANLPSVAPTAGTPDTVTETQTPPAGTGVANPPNNPPGTQSAMLPPRPETKTPTGQPAWLRFATAAPVDIRDKPRVAIVIDDLGLDRPRTERAIALAPAVTMSFLAYSGDLPRLTEAAHKAGHEMIVHVPMEPVNTKIDMGPNGLSTNQSKEEVLRRLNWDLGRFDGYVGINNHMGSRFTGDAQAMSWVMDELKSRGLMFLDSRTIAGSIGAKTAAADGVPYAERDVFLDDEQTASAVEQQLKEVEAIAKKKGTVIAIGHPHDVTLAALNAWIASLPQKGIVLVPLTEIVKVRLGLS